jgi:hypothetical protein
MNICHGDGMCLIQADTENNYIKIKDYTCEYNCSPVKCDNFLVCGEVVPKYLINQCNCCVSFQCKLSFGKLVFTDNVECPICFEVKMGVKQIKCEHKICVDCFKRCHYGIDYISQPIFPYSREIEDEYDNRASNNDPRWINDPLIKNYENEWILYELKIDETYDKEACLRICSICRK